MLFAYLTKSIYSIHVEGAPARCGNRFTSKVREEREEVDINARSKFSDVAVSLFLVWVS